MPELIDRLETIQRIKNTFCSECDCEYGGIPCSVCEYDFCIGVLNETPTIQPEQRRGEWQFLAQKNGYLWKCSACKGNFDQQYRFCPYCGALMQGGAGR